MLINGTVSADSITDTRGDDVIHGRLGDDQILSFYGNDRIYGDGGNDQIYSYGTAYGSIHGGDGNDAIAGDEIYGDRGNDDLDVSFGGVGRGGDGNDFVHVGWASGRLFGDGGDDLLGCWAMTGDGVQMTGGAGHDRFAIVAIDAPVQVRDFHHGEDEITVRTFAVSAPGVFDQLDSDNNDILNKDDAGVDLVARDLVINTDVIEDSDGTLITVRGISELTTADWHFGTDFPYG